MGKIAICGAGASGKDYLRKKMEKKGFIHSISYTSRSQREGEQHGVDYYYISRQEFEKMIEEDKFIEWDEFNGNYYGTTKEEFERSDLFILTPNGIEQISEELRKRVFVIYLKTDRVTRINRLTERGLSSSEVWNRIQIDSKTFDNFMDWDLKMENPKF